MDRFAAPLVTTLSWDDLALDADARRQVEEIARWVEHGHRKTVLFCGADAPHAAALIGRAGGRKVYRVDVAALNRERIDTLFEQARSWLLFFDEADALFGKRTESDKASDRAANQQAAYLLQRIEDFPGVVILAANLRSHIDEAFARRFQSIVRFVRQPPAK